MSPTPPQDQALLRRLAELEDELAKLRRQVQPERTRESLPAGRFSALTLNIGTELYAVPLAMVREVIRAVWITPVPEVSESILGAMNLRGRIIPVIDARKRVGISAPKLDLQTPIAILAPVTGEVGVVVDRVLDLISLDGDRLEVATGPLAAAQCVAAMAPGPDDEIIQILDLYQLLQPTYELELPEELPLQSPAPSPAADATPGKPPSKARAKAKSKSKKA
ncbi:MAG: chemotaxis protein CheW [Deltaproteobacteria bacterium]|nr:chemotaxis protein CheW [Deltaproteobacteria bacterium]